MHNLFLIHFLLDFRQLLLEPVDLALHGIHEFVCCLGLGGEEEDIVLGGLYLLFESLVHAAEAVSPLGYKGLALLLALALPFLACFLALEVFLMALLALFATLAELCVELFLGSEEAVALGTEGVIDSLIVFLRREPDFAPLVLQFLHFGGSFFPLLGVHGLSVDDRLVDLLHASDERLLGFEVSLLFGVEFVEIRLVFLIDDGGSGLEPVPEVLAQFAGYGSYLRPLVMELLEGT
jgi:hypothetical protein